MRIVSLKAENFKRLEAVEITPQSNVVLITGKNGQGKSSVLDTITAALCGKNGIPDKPIRDGQERAEIVIKTENFIIKRTFTEAGGKLTITNHEGMTAKSPQEMLDSIVGNVAFDPMSFIELGETTSGKREQKEMLMKLAGLNFDDIDKDLADIKQKRSEVKSAKETYEHEAARITVAEQTPNEEVSLKELLAEKEAAINHNNAQQTTLTEIERLGGDIAHLEETLENEEGMIKDLIARLELAKSNHLKNVDRKTELEKQVAAAKGKLQHAIDTAAIQSKIDSLESVNKNVRAKKEKANWLKKSGEKSEEFSKLGTQLKDKEAEKAKRLAEAKMPIPGLSVDENGVIFEGIPLNQVNDAKKLEIGVAIGMALNPKLKVIRLNGNGLDLTSLAAISKMVNDGDYQIWVEKVSDDDKVGIVIEDGNVKTINENLF